MNFSNKYSNMNGTIINEFIIQKQYSDSYLRLKDTIKEKDNLKYHKLIHEAGQNITWEIIDNTPYSSKNTCDSCGERVFDGAEFPCGYQESTSILCKQCLERAIEMITESRKNGCLIKNY